MSPLTKEDIVDEMKLLWPGMEYYFINFYKPNKYYCGFVDSLSHPIQGYVWRGSSLTSLLQQMKQISLTEFVPKYPTRFIGHDLL